MTPRGKRTGSKPTRSPRKKAARSTRKRRTAPTHSWSALAFWLGMAVVIAVGAGIYTRHFLAARPASLHREARRVATDLRALLESDRIPHQDVRVVAPEPMSDDEARWERTRFEVALAPEIAAATAADIVVQELASEDLRVLEDVTDSEATARLRVAIGAREVALVDLRASRSREASRPPRTVVSPPATEPTPSEPETPEPTPRRRIAAMEEEMFSALRGDLPTYDELPRDFEGHEPPAAPERPARDYDGSPRVALIVDDGGYGGEPTETILGLDPVLTLAILPFAPESRETAEAAAARGFELMLHMPMESADPSATYPGGLTVSMTPEEVREATRQALEDVPGIAGVNNHTGSRYTEDEAAISAFLAALDPNALYFVDSRTSPKSRAHDTAVRLGFPALSRDVFLDNRDDRQAILRQTDELIERARAHGAAIGICHFRPVTASVLGDVLDRLEAAGIEVVPVSQLMASTAVQSARKKDSAQ